jgi:hypothetical protein
MQGNTRWDWTSKAGSRGLSIHIVKLPDELKGLLLVHRLPTLGNLEALLEWQRKAWVGGNDRSKKRSMVIGNMLNVVERHEDEVRTIYEAWW